MDRKVSARVIFHVDLDAFYVAVERVKNPDLIGVPVIVGGLGPRGVVSTASYEARKFGVHSAQPMAVARGLCPHAVYLPGDHQRYREVSRKFIAILRGFSPEVAPVSVDEAYVDMTGTERLYGDPTLAAETIRSRVRTELKIVASIGIGPNKLLAKMASEAAKPDGVFEIAMCRAEAFLSPKRVRALPGIGPIAAANLNAAGIHTLGELANAPEGVLQRALGRRHASYVRRRARGIDDSPLVERPASKSISVETTFDTDLTDAEELLAALKRLADRVGTRLRRSGKYAGTVSIKLRYSDFDTITRQATLPQPVDGDSAIREPAERLLKAALRLRRDPVRLIGIGVSGLGEPAAQLPLLDRDGQADDSSVSRTVDAIRQRFGDAAVQRGI